MSVCVCVQISSFFSGPAYTLTQPELNIQEIWQSLTFTVLNESTIGWALIGASAVCVCVRA